VQPTDTNSEPARYLKENGEGFFLISLGTDDLIEQLGLWGKEHQQAVSLTPRQGLENWSVADLPSSEFFGAQFQLTQELTG